MKLGPRDSKALFLAICFFLPFASFGLSTTFAQPSQTLTGTVTASDGRPLPDVIVYGSLSKTCCPFKREQTKTDSSGRFTLKNPGAVIHFDAEKFEPKTWIVEPDTADVHAVLQPDSNPFNLPACKPPAPGMRRIQGGFMGLTFDIPKRNFEILGGKPDVDYVRWVIKLKSSKSFVSFWFGPYAFPSDPDDDLLLDSVSIMERNVKTSDGKDFGRDSFGQLHNGEKWRHLWIAIADGAEYRASSAEAALLDQVVDSACIIPRRN
jgi:hypothetical protein